MHFQKIVEKVSDVARRKKATLQHVTRQAQVIKPMCCQREAPPSTYYSEGHPLAYYSLIRTVANDEFCEVPN